MANRQVIVEIEWLNGRKGSARFFIDPMVSVKRLIERAEGEVKRVDTDFFSVPTIANVNGEAFSDEELELPLPTTHNNSTTVVVNLTQMPKKGDA